MRAGWSDLCPLLALSGRSADRVARSGSGRKADMPNQLVECPLMTLSGHHEISERCADQGHPLRPAPSFATWPMKLRRSASRGLYGRRRPPHPAGASDLAALTEVVHGQRWPLTATEPVHPPMHAAVGVPMPVNSKPVL
jgi:hypothetical protein